MFNKVYNDLCFFTYLLIEITRANRKNEIAISKRLSEHQTLEEWKYREASQIIHKWYKSMNKYFFEEKLTHPSICFKSTKYTSGGHYYFGINEFGLEHELNLNTLHLYSPASKIASILLHELVHMCLKLEKRESPGWYHNKHFRKMMKDFGFKVTARGQHIGKYTAGSKFGKWLTLNDVTDEPFMQGIRGLILEQITVNTDEATLPLRGAGSKLKKYSCQCGFNVRVAKGNFKALCLNCDTEFRLNEK